MFSLHTRIINLNKSPIFKFYKHKRYKNFTACSKTTSEKPVLIFSCRMSRPLSNLRLCSTNYKTNIPYKNTENKHMYDILQKIPVVDKNLFSVLPIDKLVLTVEDFNQLLDQNWRSKSVSEIVQAFKSVANFCWDNKICVSDERFDKLVDGLMDQVLNLSDNELSDLLICLTKYPLCESYDAHNFHDIWSCLDDICTWRMSKWTTETMFWFAELWYKLHLGKYSDFMFLFLQRMERRLDKCTKDQILHLYFYTKVRNKHEMAFDYQSKLDMFINYMSLDEIGIVAATLAKNKFKPKFASTCEVMIKQLKENIKAVDDMCLTNIIIVLRYSTHVLLVDQMMDLLDHLVPEIDRLSIIACTHIALLGTTHQFLHEKSLAKVSQKIIDNISKARLKDLERLLVALTMFDFDPKTTPDVFQTIYEEIHKNERIAESAKYARCLPSTLNYLSIKNLYSYELMDRILHLDYIKEVYGKRPQSLGYPILSLDVSIDVECPDYKGNRLDKQFRQKAAKWNVEYVPEWNQTYKLTVSDKFNLELTDVVGKIVPGLEYVHRTHILPHYVKSDIIICRDSRGYFVKPTGFDKYCLGDVMRPPNESFKWYAIMPLNWNMTIRGTARPLGLYNTKCRQLRAIGYEPILVFSNEFLELNKDERFKYIANKIK